jgi:hypothetical protein
MRFRVICLLAVQLALSACGPERQAAKGSDASFQTALVQTVSDYCVIASPMDWDVDDTARTIQQNRRERAKYNRKCANKK